MTNAGTTRIIIGIIGNVISFFLFLSPMPTIIKIIRAKAVEKYKADPYLATMLNCAMWVFYGLPFVHPDSTLVITINGIGFVIETCYVIVFFIYSDWRKRRKILLLLLVEAIFVAIIVIIAMKVFSTTKDRSMLVGIVCVAFNIVMYAAPLTVIKRVIQTKSVKYMPFLLSVANFANGVIWLVYAILKFDIYILIPNGLGALSGVIQLILHAMYYRTTDWNQESERRQEIEVSSREVP
ncbi:bidirectional sugar transporter SWEET5-like [Impatiens glandulifera]|uniref:bidirectional sugar transporter SWEET5-like n=1 Tax=Impatiens glandulifera TaxID=253017 RepID=UPI001FB053E2|nr:bidirectional sugar transporter SWEET5-like [Impatiens glandulifera]